MPGEWDELGGCRQQGMGLPGPGQGVCCGQHWSPQGQRQRAVGLSHLLQLLSDHTALSQTCLALPRLLSFHSIICTFALIIR